MTSSANDEWNYDQLRFAVHLLEALQLAAKTAHDHDACRHGVDFIEYNMRELEITGGNGD